MASARILQSYYEYTPDMKLTCPQCNWSGRAMDAVEDLQSDLKDFSCPSCDKMLLIVPYPTLAETKQAAETGSSAALEDMPFATQMEQFSSNFERAKLRSPNQLPDIDGQLDFIWDSEGVEGRSEVVIKCGDQVLWREPELWEGWWRFLEVKEILEAKYGPRLQSFKATQRSQMYLLGDSYSAEAKIPFI